MLNKKKILFLVGSPNQTQQMHRIAAELDDYDCYFSLVYSTNPVIRFVVERGGLNTTIIGNNFREQVAKYLQQHGLKNDYACSVFKNTYSLAVLCTDLMIPGNLHDLKTVCVQEGMTDPMTPWACIVHRLKLPALVALNTALSGATNRCDIYCAASQGYKKQFISLGTEANKIFVTGIPNYDNCRAFLENDFPYRDYVLVATSDIRETFRTENRLAFIHDCVRLANGRQLIFKLHPNELRERAEQEIRCNTPGDTLVFSTGNTAEMIANCEELITQYSSVVYIGIALGKKVHSFFDIEQLKRLAPVQNGGRSAANIAALCRQYLEFNGSKKAFLDPSVRNKIHQLI